MIQTNFKIVVTTDESREWVGKGKTLFPTISETLSYFKEKCEAHAAKNQQYLNLDSRYVTDEAREASEGKGNNIY